MSEQYSPPRQPRLVDTVEPADDVSQSALKPSALISSRVWRVIGILVLTVSVGFISAQFLPAQMAIASALAVFCIGLWATAVVPEYWPALAFFLLAVVFKIAPADTVFSGFHSSTFWLLFSGLILGAAIKHTGLSRHTAALLSPLLGRRYGGVISAIVLFGVALAFVIPSSMGRVALLLPIVAALAEQMGYNAASKGRIGMLSAATFGTFLPAFAILPANGPNMILAGMAENIYDQQLAYWDYLLLHFPVLGIVKAGLLVVMILWMFPDRDPLRTAEVRAESVPMGREAWHMVALLVTCLVLWLTDGFHQISPGWIGLAAALYCLWPPTRLTGKDCLNEDIKYGPLFFVAGVMGLGAVISASGLGDVMLQSLSGRSGFDAEEPVRSVVILTGISTLLAVVTTLASVPSLMTPLAQELAGATGLTLTSVLMTQVLAFSNVLLPYQAPPLVMAMQVGKLPVAAVTRLCLAMFVVGTVVLVPLDLLWWALLGKL